MNEKIKDLYYHVNLLFDAYNAMSRRMKRMEKQIEELKGNKVEEEDTEKVTKTLIDMDSIDTKYPHMKIISAR